MVWLEYFGVITGLLYLFLEIKQHKAMWVVGFLTSLVYVFVFLSAKIYADMGLQTYYVGISIYGFYQWTRKKHEIHTENDSLPSDCILYTHLSLPLFVGIIVNLVSVYLYYLRGLYPTMLLYFCYATLAIVGYYNWRKKGEEF